MSELKHARTFRELIVYQKAQEIAQNTSSTD